MACMDTEWGLIWWDIASSFGGFSGVAADPVAEAPAMEKYKLSPQCWKTELH